jgi:hypothetical protein
MEHHQELLPTASGRQTEACENARPGRDDPCRGMKVKLLV